MRLRRLLKKDYVTNSKDKKRSEVPEGIYVKCPKCKKSIYRPDLKGTLGICPHCGYYYPLTAKARISLIVDKNTFKEFNQNLDSVNPLGFKEYEEKLAKYKNKTGQREAVVTGKGKIEGREVVIAIMDSTFMMGSMG